MVQATATIERGGLREAREVVRGALAAVEETLAALSAGMPGELGAVTEGLLRSGKRLRPLVLLLAAGEEAGGEPAVALAAAVEEIHAASLVHDDVIDGAEQRRGRPSAPAALGQRAAVLAGDYLAAAAYRQVTVARLPGAVETLAEAAVQMTLAEVSGSVSRGELLSEAQYLGLIAGKTGALFAASAYLGGLVAGLPADDREALRRYGQALGQAFQIRDDLLDLYGEAGDLGKPVRHDLEEGVYTLPLIYAAAGPGGEMVRERLRRWNAGEGNGALAEEIALLARRLGGQGYAAERLESNIAQARAALPEIPNREHLAALAGYLAGAAV
jgi:octaprenyl-diphosphate synthase